MRVSVLRHLQGVDAKGGRGGTHTCENNSKIKNEFSQAIWVDFRPFSILMKFQEFFPLTLPLLLSRCKSSFVYRFTAKRMKSITKNEMVLRLFLVNDEKKTSFSKILLLFPRHLTPCQRYTNTHAIRCFFCRSARSQ